MTNEQVEVTQTDREAAADWHASWTGFGNHSRQAAAIRCGNLDGNDLVQAFARHRLACSVPSAPPELCPRCRGHFGGTALPEDHGELLQDVRIAACGYRLTNQEREQINALADAYETLSREIERQTAAADHWSDFARTLAEKNVRVRAETLEEAGLSQRVQESILRAMNAGNISQRALAKQIGVTDARVCQMLSDGSNLTLRTVERVFSAIRNLTTGSGAGEAEEDAQP